MDVLNKKSLIKAAILGASVILVSACQKDMQEWNVFQPKEDKVVVEKAKHHHHKHKKYHHKKRHTTRTTGAEVEAVGVKAGAKVETPSILPQ